MLQKYLKWKQFKEKEKRKNEIDIRIKAENNGGKLKKNEWRKRLV